MASLKWSGAVVIDGPKAVGKTETARQAAASEALLDTDLALQSMAQADPSLVLAGSAPRLLDEWQTIPNLWNAVRREVDRRGVPGQFILTGSASPADDKTRHTGTGRFSRLRMYPLSLMETGHASGSVSLGELLAGEAANDVVTGPDLPEIIERMITGGWPGAQELDVKERIKYARAYLDQSARMDILSESGAKHEPPKVNRLIRSIARNVATEATLKTLAADAGGSEQPLHRETVVNYLQSLQRIFVLEEQEAWGPTLRTRTPLREAPKRHLTDSSLTCAALRIGSVDRLLADPETLGLVFESFAVQQLRTYASLVDAEVFHYRDKSGLECDAIVQNAEGDWLAVEVKLGPGLVDTAVASLNKLESVVDQSASGELKAKIVLLPTGPSYVRPDGVQVVSLTTLGP